MACAFTRNQSSHEHTLSAVSRRLSRHCGGATKPATYRMTANAPDPLSIQRDFLISLRHQHGTVHPRRLPGRLLLRNAPRLRSKPPCQQPPLDGSVASAARSLSGCAGTITCGTRQTTGWIYWHWQRTNYHPLIHRQGGEYGTGRI